MLNYRFNVCLKSYNTLALAAKAKAFVEINHENDLLEALAYGEQKSLDILLLSGGSNIVFSNDFDGLVIHIAIQGVSIEQHDDHVLVTAGAGENWHQLAMNCLNKGISGLENLVLIPGCVGAAPIQNIGAYGVELKDVFDSLKGWDRQQRCWRTLQLNDCHFAYRDSIFKGKLKDHFIITEVRLKLSRNTSSNVEYRILNDYLHEQNITRPSPLQVAHAVIAIRSSKLPDPLVLANTGSFFKNPVVSNAVYEQIIQQYPSMPHYPAERGNIKLAAGWLLEAAGWKGATQGDCGMHSKQALVLVNHGHATGKQVISFAKAIQQDIADKFGVTLEIEPRIY